MSAAASEGSAAEHRSRSGWTVDTLREFVGTQLDNLDRTVTANAERGTKAVEDARNLITAEAERVRLSFTQMREATKSDFAGQEKAVAAALASVDKGVAAAFAAAEKAVASATEALESRLAGINEMRAMLNDQAKTFTTIAASDAERKNVVDALGGLTERVEKLERGFSTTLAGVTGSRSAKDDSRAQGATVMAVVGTGIAIAALVLTYLRRGP